MSGASLLAWRCFSTRKELLLGIRNAQEEREGGPRRYRRYRSTGKEIGAEGCGEGDRGIEWEEIGCEEKRGSRLCFL
jgi:hypothetical protein